MQRTERFSLDVRTGLHLPPSHKDAAEAYINFISERIKGNVVKVFPAFEPVMVAFNPETVAGSLLYKLAPVDDEGVGRVIDLNFFNWYRMLKELRWSPDEIAAILQDAAPLIINLRLYPTFEYSQPVKRVFPAIHVDNILPESYFHQVVAPLSLNGFMPRIVNEDEKTGSYTAVLSWAKQPQNPTEPLPRHGPYA